MGRGGVKTAKAAVLTGPRTLEIQDFPLPDPGDNAGLMKVEACGVCGSDVPVWKGESSFELPVVLGHEIVGRAQSVGAERKAVGAQVALGSHCTEIDVSIQRCAVATVYPISRPVWGRPRYVSEPPSSSNE